VILLLRFKQRRGEPIKSGDKGGFWPIFHTGGKKEKNRQSVKPNIPKSIYEFLTIKFGHGIICRVAPLADLKGL
jgi:hypothetical protein